MDNKVFIEQLFNPEKKFFRLDKSSKVYQSYRNKKIIMLTIFISFINCSILVHYFLNVLYIRYLDSDAC